MSLSFQHCLRWSELLTCFMERKLPSQKSGQKPDRSSEAILASHQNNTWWKKTKQNKQALPTFRSSEDDIHKLDSWKRRQKIDLIRLHSSRMRTACLLTVSQHALSGGLSAQRGCMCVANPPPRWTEWQAGIKTLPCRNFVAGGN